jgi:hypothetical protein
MSIIDNLFAAAVAAADKHNIDAVEAIADPDDPAVAASAGVAGLRAILDYQKTVPADQFARELTLSDYALAHAQAPIVSEALLRMVRTLLM